ncbi:ATP-binding protein [Streptomyces sp. NPDC057877]|uniref:ATP-binding protein n=1 Tax=Streptomyces sp. NPDC057877 TaxID=3346269 RepID=UPI00369B9FDF
MNTESHRTWYRRFMPVVENVAEARHGVRVVLDSWAVPKDTAETVALIVTELAANAVTHARRPGRTFDVGLTCDGGKTIEIEVFDPCPRHPTPKPYDPEATSGRGLLLVESLSDTWEVRERECGKTVWVRVVR